MKKLYPPYGYKWVDGEGIAIDDFPTLKRAALDISDDPKWKIAVEKHATSAKEILKMFKANGYEVYDEK